MLSTSSPNSPPIPTPLDRLDRAAIGYLTLPLLIFVVSWFEWWAAVPLLACSLFALRPLVEALPAADAGSQLTRLQLTAAIVAAMAWTLCGGAAHFLFANADWFVRDAVLHDLVESPWPVGYGLWDGRETLLRAPVAFYLPAALAGKALGLPAAHWCMGLWTVVGTSLFLLQVLSLLPSKAKWVAASIAVVILFSGFDIVGNIINTGPRFLQHWNIAKHLEWWAGTYQYSSMTTQLFWVPNHALGGWLLIGLMARHPRYSALDSVLPFLLVAAALWSPLSAVGVLPFAAWKAYRSMFVERRWSLLHPRVWLPALVVGSMTVAYLILDPSRIPKGLSVGGGDFAHTVMALVIQAQFFLLEAGIIGFAILAIRRSAEIFIALAVLALLPLAHLGPANDLVMRASIPSLAVLTIGACLAFSRECVEANALRKKVVLAFLLAIGAVTPVQEFARAAILPSWPVNLQATLIGTNCGAYPAQYVARLGGQITDHFLKTPHALPVGSTGKLACANPATDLMSQGGLLPD